MNFKKMKGTQQYNIYFNNTIYIRPEILIYLYLVHVYKYICIYVNRHVYTYIFMDK